MNFELQKPKHLISLASSALVVHVEVNVWTATKQDKQISNEVTTAKRADANAGKFTQNLLANCAEHKAVLNYRQTIYNWLQRCTYDWAGAMRLLPLAKIEQFRKELDAHKVEFNRLLDEFCAKYPSLVSDAAFKQGDMFDRSAYPDIQDVRSRFRLNEIITQVPENDFRSNIASVIADDLSTHYEKQTQQIVESVMSDAAERLVTIAERISVACSEPEPSDEDGKKVKRKKVYESTITQAREICDVLKDFNLTGNDDLERARAQLDEALRDVTLEDLRESSYVRSKVKDSVDDMLSKFKPLGVFNV